MDVAQDLQPTRLQKSLYPDHTRLFGALCALGAGLGDLMQSTRRLARRRVLDLDSCCRGASGRASRNADAYPSPT